MKGDAKVLAILGEVLTAELTSINQYMVHAEMCQKWNYEKLHKHIFEEAKSEMGHAEKLIERILYLEGVPDVERYFPVRIGKNVREMLQNDLDLEQEAVRRLNAGIRTCVEQADNGSRELLEHILEDEEGHIAWIEAQLRQIQDMGLENYLSSMK